MTEDLDRVKEEPEASQAPVKKEIKKETGLPKRGVKRAAFLAQPVDTEPVVGELRRSAPGLRATALLEPPGSSEDESNIRKPGDPVSDTSQGF